MNPHDIENAKPVDPAGAILERLKAFIDEHPSVTSPKRLAHAMHVVVHELGMKVLKEGTIEFTPGQPPRWDHEIRNWSFDIREWLRNEHGAVVTQLPKGHGRGLGIGVRK